MEDPAQKTPINLNDQVSSVRREIEIAAHPSQEIAHSEQAPILSEEVKEAGVEATVLAPNLTKEHFDVGISHSPEAVKPNLEPTGAVSFPMTKTEAVSAERGRDDDSRTWFGTLLAKIYRRLGTLSLREAKS